MRRFGTVGLVTQFVAVLLSLVVMPGLLRKVAGPRSQASSPTPPVPLFRPQQ